MIEKPITEVECAYLAGLIDARGYVRMRRQKRDHNVERKIVLEIGPLKPFVARWLTSRFGGTTVESRYRVYRVSFVTKSAAVICVHAYPYLLDRKDDARLVTRFAASLKGHGFALPEESEKIRLEVDRDLKALHEKRKVGKA